MKAEQIRAHIKAMGFTVEWSDLRRGVLHIRIRESVRLVHVQGAKDAAMLSRMVCDGLAHGRELTTVKGSRYYIESK